MCALNPKGIAPETLMTSNEEKIFFLLKKKKKKSVWFSEDMKEEKKQIPTCCLRVINWILIVWPQLTENYS